MADIPVLPGITSTFVDTPRLRQHVLTCGPADGTPIVFIHGNFSAATYWEELMLALAGHGPSTASGRGFRCIAPDLRGYGWTEDKLIDATRGYRDWSDDLDSLVKVLGLPPHAPHWLVCRWWCGISLRRRPSGAVAHRNAARRRSAPMVSAAARVIEGTPCYDDYAGSGGGVVNPAFRRPHHSRRSQRS